MDIDKIDKPNEKLSKAVEELEACHRLLQITLRNLDKIQEELNDKNQDS